jgi:hypothetical protein
MAITLAQLRARSQVISDCYRFTDAEWNEMVNDGIRALYADVIAVNPDFRVSTADFSITSTATPQVALSTATSNSFRAERAVQRDPGLSTMTYLPRFSMRDGQVEFERSYRLQGDLLIIEPRERSIGSYRLFYNPAPPVLASDGATLDAELEQFQDCVIQHAAMLAMISEETDIAQIAVALGTARARVKPWAAGQRSSNPTTIEDRRGYATSRSFVRSP